MRTRPAQKADAAPDKLARKLFVITMFGVFVYVTAVIVMMSQSSP